MRFSLKRARERGLCRDRLAHRSSEGLYCVALGSRRTGSRGGNPMNFIFLRIRVEIFATTFVQFAASRAWKSTKIVFALRNHFFISRIPTQMGESGARRRVISYLGEDVYTRKHCKLFRYTHNPCTKNIGPAIFAPLASAVHHRGSNFYRYCNVGSAFIET